MPLVPTFAPATDDTAARDEMDVATVDDDGKTDGFPLAPTITTEIDDAAGSDEVGGPVWLPSMVKPIVCYWHQHLHQKQTTQPAALNVNVGTRSDEETGGLLLAPTFAIETDDANGSDDVNTAAIKSESLDSSSSPVC